MINLVISVITSIIAAYFYEKFTNWRNKNYLYKKYSFLESKIEFDWEHWDITSGVIEKNPIKSTMKLKYEGKNDFSYEYKNEETNEKGTGNMAFDEIFLGKMSFFVEEKKWFDYRNICYKVIEHPNEKYQCTKFQAIFVNADDQGGKYVMLRCVVELI